MPLSSVPPAQQPYLHLNPSIVKLASGKPMIGGQRAGDARVRYMPCPQMKTSKHQQPPALRG